eukprot:jgi/Chlat1/7575/Chrsp63S07086
MRMLSASPLLCSTLLLLLLLLLRVCDLASCAKISASKQVGGVKAQVGLEYQPECSRTCVAKDCRGVGLRYGKYCGVGWTGCEGLLDNGCHADLIQCMRKARQKQGGEGGGFSDTCPYEVVMPTIEAAMNLAMLFGQR